MTTVTATCVVHRAADRHHWRSEWLESWQSFPATGNYDLEGNAHGVLMVNNDDTVDAGEGLDTHQHQNAEILTWVVEGAVAHRDSHGNRAVIRPGEIQRMSAGTGIRHSEYNAATRAEGTPARIIQMWLPPDTANLPPSYAEADISEALAAGEPVIAASGMARDAGVAAVDLGNRYVALHIARPEAGATITLPAAPFGHLFLTRGAVEYAGEDGVARLENGDALRTTDAGELSLTVIDDAELLYWEMHATFDRG